MSDLVQRLRALSAYQHDDLSIGSEAADELDRLTALLAQDIHSCHQGCTRSGCVNARLTRELEEARKAAALYETARRMNPRQWAAAWEKNITTGKPFDEIVAEHASRKDALDRMARNADELGLDF